MRIGRHLHATFFDYHDHGTTLTPTVRMIDMAMPCQGAHRPRVFGLPGTEARRLMSGLPSGTSRPRLILLVIHPKQEQQADTHDRVRTRAGERKSVSASVYTVDNEITK